MQWDDVEQRLERAARAFRKFDDHLLEVNANERSMTHKFAEHLQKEYPDYHVDCEYNRDGSEKKEIRSFQDATTSTSDSDAATVFPDIIVHRRGTNAHNHLVIEAKKVPGKSDTTDRKKLKVFLEGEESHGLAYSYGVLLCFHTGANPRLSYERVS
jgi:hypothetical protein